MRGVSPALDSGQTVVTDRVRARRVLSALAAIALLAGASACASRDGGTLERDAEQLRTGPPVPYTVTFTGVPDELADYLRSVSEAAAGVDDPPGSLLALRRRARTDADRLTRALGGVGYYDGTVAAAVTPAATAGGDALVRFGVTPGPRYRFGTIDIELTGETGGYRPPSLAELGLEPGAPALAQTVIDAEARLFEDARARSHAYADIGDRTAIIDRETKTLDVVLRLDPGPPVALGEVTFEGADGIDQDFLESRVEWKPGAPYTPEAIQETQRALVETGLFRTVTVDLPLTPPAEGVAPVAVRTEQRLHRTISAGIRYDTDGGPGGNFAWEHRNIFGSGERFRAEADANLLAQSLGASLRTPEFYGRSRSFLANAAAVRETTDAFDSLSVTANAGVEQEFTPNLFGTLGLGYELSEVTDNGRTTSFSLVFVPGVLRYDDTGSPLDPERGVRARFAATPFWDLLQPGLAFQKFRLDGSSYFKVLSDPRLVVAVRGALGSIVGAGLASIPANRRFYAGGGGSIRGVPFQAASPRNDDGDIIGGRSVFEVSAEIRYDITATIGAAAFVDGGRAYEASFPDFDQPLIFGTGVGARYYTPIGPVRLDVAVPINPDGFDESFQIYVSLGQAF